MERRRVARSLRAGDAAAVVFVVLCAIVFLFLSMSERAAGDRVRIRTDDADVQYPLHAEADYSLRAGGYTLTVTVRDGTVSVTESDCPSGQCMADGEIARVGESIVCLPAHVLIEVIGEEDASDVDWILP